MVDFIHKAVMFFASPLTVGLGSLILGLALLVWRMRREKESCRLAVGFLVGSVIWLYVWSTPLMTRLEGLSLERDYPSQTVDSIVEADAIVLLGGGMDADTNVCSYAEMGAGADRVWHAARLFKAGKSRRITLSGGRIRESTVPLLADLGVPQEGFLYFEDAKNTEDEARMIAAAFRELGVAAPKILLVTSAWHMRRAKWLFERAGIEVVPAATDYETTVRYGGAPIGVSNFLPDAESLYRNTYLFKEHFAYWCYRILR